MRWSKRQASCVSGAEGGVVALDHFLQALARLQGEEQFAIEQRLILALARFGIAEILLPSCDARILCEQRLALAMHRRKHRLTFRRSARGGGDLSNQIALALAEDRVLQAVPLVLHAGHANAL